MKKFLVAVLPVLVLSSACSQGTSHLPPKHYCGGNVELSGIAIRVTKTETPAFFYSAVLTNVSSGSVTFTAKLANWKAGVKVVVPMNETMTLGPGKGRNVTLGQTYLPNGNDPGLNWQDLENATSVTCK